MTTYNAQNMTWLQRFTVGDIITNKETIFPHLDMVGDVGYLSDKESQRKVAKFVVINLHENKQTNEALMIDIQIVESYDHSKCFPNPSAICAIHHVTFPCEKCMQLEMRNYS